MQRTRIADLILSRIAEVRIEIQEQFDASEPKIGAFVIDNLLPDTLAREIGAKFPEDGFTLRNSLRERKLVSAQLNAHDPLIEEALYAFHDSRIVEAIGEICHIPNMTADEHLYAGGISAMAKGHFLNPHLDNSHDKDRDRWRVLNLLYYVNPEWQESFGGNLELWPDGVDRPQRTIGSIFNRLVVMTTHQRSWHSVSPVEADLTRTCISNYYFAPEPLKISDKFHVTTFRGRPEQKLVDIALQVDGAARSFVRKIAPSGVVKTKHLYERKED